MVYSAETTDTTSSQIYPQPLQLDTHIAQIGKSAFGHFKAGDQDLADAMGTDQSGQVFAAEDSIAPQQHPGLPGVIVNESDRPVTIRRITQQFPDQNLAAIAGAVNQHRLGVGRRLPLSGDQRPHQPERDAAGPDEDEQQHAVENEDGARRPIELVKEQYGQPADG